MSLLLLDKLLLLGIGPWSLLIYYSRCLGDKARLWALQSRAELVHTLTITHRSIGGVEVFLPHDAIEHLHDRLEPLKNTNEIRQGHRLFFMWFCLGRLSTIRKQCLVEPRQDRCSTDCK